MSSLNTKQSFQLAASKFYILFFASIFNISYSSLLSVLWLLILMVAGENSLAEQSFSEQVCYDDLLQLREIELSENSVAYVVENNHLVEITITLEAVLEQNTTADTEFPKTTTLAPKSVTELAKFGAIDRNADWSFRYRYHWQWGSNSAEHRDDFIYNLPYPSGKTYFVSQGFDGEFSHSGKNAVDFAMPVSSEVHAARSGVVVFVRDSNQTSGRSAEYRKYSNYLIVLHEDRTISQYHHLDYLGSMVEVGQLVSQGQLIAYSGDTGYAMGPHLHFEVTSPINGFDYFSYPVLFRSSGNWAVLPRAGLTLTAP